MKILIFDIDGTLTDTTAVDDKCFINAFRETFDLDISQVDWSTFKHVTDRGISEEIFEREFDRHPTAEEFQNFINNLEALFLAERKRDPNQFKEVLGASQFYHLIKQDPNFKIGIATGSCRETALIKLSLTDIDLDAVANATSNDATEREQIMLKTIGLLKDQLGSEPEDIIYIGDGVWDYKACRNLNVRFIGIDYKKNSKLINLGAKHVFPDFTAQEELLKLL